MTGCERSWKTQSGGWRRRLAGDQHNHDHDDVDYEEDDRDDYEEDDHDDLDDDYEEDDHDDDDPDQVIGQLIRLAGDQQYLNDHDAIIIKTAIMISQHRKISQYVQAGSD